jgi:hypothetical protein
MVLRIVQVTTHPGREAAFGRFFHDTAIPLMRRTPGRVSVLPGAPRPETPGAFAMVMQWERLAALKAFAGADYASAHVHPDEAGLVAARRVAH